VEPERYGIPDVEVPDSDARSFNLAGFRDDVANRVSEPSNPARDRDHGRSFRRHRPQFIKPLFLQRPNCASHYPGGESSLSHLRNPGPTSTNLPQRSQLRGATGREAVQTAEMGRFLRAPERSCKTDLLNQPSRVTITRLRRFADGPTGIRLRLCI
jgi:hypothetical protein